MRNFGSVAWDRLRWVPVLLVLFFLSAAHGATTGTWDIEYNWGCGANPGYGTWWVHPDGTFTSDEGGGGTWSVSGLTIEFVFTGNIVVYRGTFDTENEISSGVIWFEGSNAGCWHGSCDVPDQEFATLQKVRGYADHDWSFLTAWNLRTGHLKVSASWFNGNSNLDYSIGYGQWIAQFLYDEGSGQTRQLKWSYIQPHVQ